MIDELQVPDRLPNLALYYDRAVKAYFKKPSLAWSHREANTLSEIIGKWAAKRRKEYCNDKTRQFLEIPALSAIISDVEVYGLHKYTCLIKWLDPNGIAKEAPDLVSEIAKKFLSDDVSPRLK